MGMDLDDVLRYVPKGWVFSIEQPRLKAMVRVVGKKRPQPMRFTVYFSNGKDFGTREFVSIFTDGDDLLETIEKAFSGINEEIIRRQEEDKKSGKRYNYL